MVSNWHLGWTMICLGLLSGAALGLGFHRETFLGGYASYSRRLCRLGHISLVALGALNVLYAISANPNSAWYSQASWLWLAGGISMPIVCFMSAWLPAWRLAFAIPVVVLLASTALTIWGGPR